VLEARTKRATVEAIDDSVDGAVVEVIRAQRTQKATKAAILALLLLASRDMSARG
jgi:hypothetical protein